MFSGEDYDRIMQEVAMAERDSAVHLIPTISDRGFAYLPTLPGVTDGSVRVHESSSAERPCIWLSVNGSQGTVQLDTEVAAKLAEQIRWLIDHHHRG